MKEIIRHIIGYMVGIILFILLIPLCLYKLSSLDWIIFKPSLFINLKLHIILSIPFFLTGTVFMIWSNIFLLLSGKGGPAEAFNISISPKTKKLVTSGPYRFTRNPMVFGALSLYISIGIFLHSIICLLCILILMIVVKNYLKLSEEKRLLKVFGDAYADYKNEVSMIFPFKKILK